MVLSLIILKKQVNLDRIPGFDRLKGLMILLALAFLVGLFLVKLRFVVLFHSSILMLFIFALLAFIAFKWAGRKLFK